MAPCRLLSHVTGVLPIKGSTLLIGDNLGSLISMSSPTSPCKKKHSQIAYHYVRECNAAGIISVRKINTEYNYADVGTKALGKKSFWEHLDDYLVSSYL